MPHRRVNVRVPLPASSHWPAGVSMATTLHLPERIAPSAPLVFLFPGATYARGYFDLQPPGFADYSQAAHHVAQGFVVVAVDHLGAGDSSVPEDAVLLPSPAATTAPRFTSGGIFTMTTMGAACDACVRAVVAGVRNGSLDPALPAMKVGAVVGMGQSMGGHVITVAQGNHATFDAIAILGSSFTQTRLTPKPGHRFPIRNASAEVILRAAQTEVDVTAAWHGPDEPPDLVAIDMNPTNLPVWRSRSTPLCATTLMQPYAVAREAGQVRAPVLLVYGEIDVTPEPLADVAMFRSTCDISLLIVPRMAHMHNFAPTRQYLWQRLDDFVRRGAATPG